MYSQSCLIANSDLCINFMDLPILKDINRKGGFCMILFLLLFFTLQSFVMFCCLAAGKRSCVSGNL